MYETDLVLILLGKPGSQMDQYLWALWVFPLLLFPPYLIDFHWSIHVISQVP